MQRLHLAEHDAAASSVEAQRGVGSSNGAAGSSADGGGAAWSFKGAANSGGRDRAGAQQRDGAAGVDQDQGGVRSTPSCAPYLDHPEDHPEEADGLHLGAAPSHLGLRGEGERGLGRGGPEEGKISRQAPLAVLESLWASWLFLDPLLAPPGSSWLLLAPPGSSWIILGGRGDIGKRCF